MENTAMPVRNRNRVGLWILNLLLVNLFLAGSLVANDDLRLVDAVKSKDKNTVRALLKEDVDVNSPQGNGTTALHWAAHWNDLATADLLIGAGAEVNVETDLGVTPLYLAAEIGSSVMTRKLLSAGADPNVASETGVSPLMLAARGGSTGSVEALLSHGADVNSSEQSSGQTALMWAVAQGQSEVVRVLVEHGTDVHLRTNTSRKLVNRGGTSTYEDFTNVEYVKTGGSTALLFAAGRGSIESARYLLEFGANVNDTAADSNSALVLAAHSGQGAFAEFLLDRGADPNANGTGYAALHAAVLRGDLDLVKALLAHEANPNIRIAKGTPYRRQSADFYLPVSLVGATPLILAAKYASADMIRSLAASGADLQLVAADGTTPLIAAANPSDNQRQPASNFLRKPRDYEESRSLEAVRALLDLGVDIDAVNAAGNTALHVVASGRYDTIVQLLLERGAKLDLKNELGKTPLALASVVDKVYLDRPHFNKSDPNSTANLLRKFGAIE